MMARERKQKKRAFQRLGGKQDGYTLNRTVSADEIIQMAQRLLRQRLRKGRLLTDATITRAYVQLKMATLKREVFALLLLDTRHRVITFENIFYGTIDSAIVYPREIVKATLNHNAAAVILVHNHPSGNAEPSQADHHITQRVKEALTLIDVRVLDHIIVSVNNTVSLADRGQI